jgi:hypothetical protein
MRNVRVQLGPSSLVALGLVRPHPRPTLVAVLRAEVVLAPASRTPRGELPAWHRNEQALGAADNLQVAYHEAPVERDCRKRLQFRRTVFGKVYAYVSDFH